MNLNVLSYILDNAQGKIEELAKENKLEPSVSIGIAKRLFGNHGDVSQLTDKQLHHYEKCIRPLIENVSCDGVIGLVEDGNTCSNGTGYIDDESLKDCYILDNFKCQHCRHDAEKMK